MSRQMAAVPCRLQGLKQKDTPPDVLLLGANDVTRTHDLLITNQLLYRLSYISIWDFVVPTTTVY